jgi:proliferating cell nuclear antigen
MIIKLENPKILTDVVGIISELVTEVRIRVDKYGLSIIAIDPANVALVSFKMPANMFSAFEANEEIIGVSLDAFKNVLKRISGSLVMQTEENNLRIESQEGTRKMFNLALINIEQEEKTMPMLDFNCNAQIESGDFSEAIADCAVISEACSFICKDSKFLIEAKGLNSIKSEIKANVAGFGKSKYSLEYLQKFARAAKLTTRTIVSFSDDYPLKLEYKDNWELAFILAPRVENED